jgi:hypothetical protein
MSKVSLVKEKITVIKNNGFIIFSKISLAYVLTGYCVIFL